MLYYVHSPHNSFRGHLDRLSVVFPLNRWSLWCQARVIQAMRECACCHTKTIVTYFMSKICWQLYVKLLIWLQFKYISWNETRTPKFFALLISSNIFHWQDLQHLKKMLPFRYAFSREANRKSKVSTCWHLFYFKQTSKSDWWICFGDAWFLFD